MLKSHFLEDARAWLFSELGELENVPPADTDLAELALLYFNVVWRRIQPAPRAVHMSSQLRAKLASPAVDAEIRTAIDAITRLSMRGEILWQHQSRTIDDIAKHDYLLNDWFIHHLHVGALQARRPPRNPRARPFTGRRGELLYVYATSENLYMIDLLGHGESFTDRSLVHIIHQEWPQLLKPCRLKGISPGVLLSGADLRKARTCLTVLLTMDDGTVYMPPGLGTMSSGVSSAAVEMSDRFVRGIVDLEKRVRDQAQERVLRDRVEEQGGYLQGELDLELRIGPTGRVVLVDRVTSVRITTDLSLMANGSFQAKPIPGWPKSGVVIPASAGLEM